jgi:hypothetical protein
MPRVDGEYQVPFPDVQSDTTIESAVHNGIVHDLVDDANFPRPVTAGGTNGRSPTEARANLSVEVRSVVVTNYDDHVFEVGSYFSAVAATAAPNAIDPFVGICLRHSVSGDLWLSAVSQTTGTVYNRRRTTGVWGAWAVSFLNPTDAASKDYVNTTVAATVNTFPSGLQVNGAMEVSQQFGTTAGITVNSYNAADNWTAVISDGVAVVDMQNIVPPGSPSFGTAFRSCFQIKATTGGVIGDNSTDAVRFSQKIEGYRVARLRFGSSAASPVTIAFWVYATVAGTMAVTIFNKATTRSYVTDVIINSGATWEYKTVTIPGDQSGTWLTDNDLGMEIGFSFGAGTSYQATANTWVSALAIGTLGSSTNFFSTANNVVCLTGVIVLPGIQAPTSAQSIFLARPYDEEFATCQRYFQKVSARAGGGTPVASGMVFSATQAQFPMRLAPPMRIAPTIFLNSLVSNYPIRTAGGVISPSALTATLGSVDSIQINATASGMTAGQAAILQLGSPSNPDLMWDARL